MVDNTGNLLHSTFSPWTGTQNETEKNSCMSTLAQDVSHWVVAPSLPTLLRKCSLLALSQQLSLKRHRQMCFVSFPLFLSFTYCCSETLTYHNNGYGANYKKSLCNYVDV